MSANKDTHGQPGKGWIGVDLDGTLALYDGWRGGTHIGEPVPAMLRRVKRWVVQGRDVRIFTARCNPTSSDWAKGGREALDEWMKRHIGRVLPVTCAKDGWMLELWDDRAIQVIVNSGARADGRR